MCSMWCIMCCWNRVKPSQGIGIERNWCVWAEHWRRNGYSTYQKRHDKVILQHDNARPYATRSVKTYLETLNSEVLPHPPYSPDVAPSDYYLLRSMAHGLAYQHFRTYEEVKCVLPECKFWVTRGRHKVIT